MTNVATRGFAGNPSQIVMRGIFRTYEQTVKNSIISQYTIASTVSKPITSRYTIEGRVTNQIPSQYEINGRIKKVILSRYKINNVTTNQVTSKYSIREIVNNSQNIQDDTVYDNISFSLSSQLANPTGITFNNDRSKMYVVGSINDTVHQYTLSTPGDVSTAVYDNKSKTVSSQETNPRAIAFNGDMSKMYIIGFLHSSVFQYTLSTPGDVSTATYDNLSFSVFTQAQVPTGIAFNPDMSKMYVVDVVSDSVYQYTLSTPGDASTATYDNKSTSVFGETTSPTDVTFNDKMSKMFILTSTPDRAHQYTLSTPGDVSTATYDNLFYHFTNLTASTTGFVFSADFTKVYVVETGDDTVYQYSTLLPREGFPSQYTIDQRIEKIITSQYSINDTVANQVTSVYSINDTITEQVTSVYSINDTVTNQVTSVYEISGVAKKQIVSAYEIFGVAKKQITSGYKIDLGISNEFVSKYSIEERILNQTTSKYEINDVITNQITSIYEISGVAKKQITSEYEIKKTVTNRIVSVYEINDVITNQIVSTYEINDVITNQITSRYEIKQTISNTISSQYEIEQKVTNSVTSIYTIGNRVVKQAGSTYLIISRVTNVIPSEYEIKKIIINSISSQYEIKNTVSKSISSQYEIKITKTNQITSRYEIKDIVSNIIQSRYDIRRIISNSFSSKYAIKNTVSDTIISQYAVREHIPNHFRSRYEIVGRITNQITSRYTIENRVSNSIPSEYEIREHVENSIPSQYTIEQKSTKTVTSEYQIIQRVTNTYASSYYKIEGRTRTAIPSSYAIIQRIVKDTSSVYQIKNNATNSIISTYKIIGRVTNSILSQYEIELRTQHSIISHYTIKQLAEKTTPSKYQILELETNQIESKYSIRNKTANSIFSQYEIEAKITKSFQSVYSIRLLVRNTDKDGLADAIYDTDTPVSITSLDGAPSGFYLDKPGINLFVVGEGTNTVYQFVLDTAGKTSTMRYVDKSFYVGNQEIITTSVYLNDDLSKMWILGVVSNKIHQYTLSTPGDLSTATYDIKSFSVKSQEGSPRGLSFNDDFTKMWVVGHQNDKVHQYSLSTAEDISTASYDSKSFSVRDQELTPAGMYVNVERKVFFVIGTHTDTIYKYEMPDPNDISTARYTGVSLDVSAYEVSPSAIRLSDDLSDLYILGFVTDQIHQYHNPRLGLSKYAIKSEVRNSHVSTYTIKEFVSKTFLSQYAIKIPVSITLDSVYDIRKIVKNTDNEGLGNAVYDTDAPVSVSSLDGAPSGFYLDKPGINLFIVGEGTNTVYQFVLDVSGKTSTMRYISKSFYVGNQETITTAVYLNNDLSKMWILGAISDKIHQYTLTTPGDITSAVYDNKSFSVKSQEPDPRGLSFNDAFTKMWVVGHANDKIHQYSLSTSEDIASAVYDNKSFSVRSQELAPSGMYVNTSKKAFFVIGTHTDTVYKYEMPDANDISTARYTGVSLNVSAHEMSPSAIRFSDDLSNLYVLGFVNKQIHQYHNPRLGLSKYGIITTVTNSVDCKYVIESKVAKIIPSQYKIEMRITKSVTSKYSILKTVGTKSFASDYSIRVIVSDGILSNYTIIGKITNDTISQYSIISRVVHDVTSLYSIREIIANIILSHYVINILLVNFMVSQYAIRSIIADTILSQYDINILIRRKHPSIPFETDDQLSLVGRFSNESDNPFVTNQKTAFTATTNRKNRGNFTTNTRSRL